MSLGSGIIPWQTCPYCKEVSLAIRPCTGCGLSHAEARIKAGENLCLCDATRSDSGWNILHEVRPTCPEDRGVDALPR